MSTIKTTTICAVIPAVITPVFTLPSGQYSGIQEGDTVHIPQHTQPEVRDSWDIEYPSYPQRAQLVSLPHYTIPVDTRIRGMQRVVVTSVAGVVAVSP